MKTTILALSALSLLAGTAVPQASALTIFGLEIKAPVQKVRCHMIDGNYVNIATSACSDNGSGGVGYVQDRTRKCDHETKHD